MLALKEGRGGIPQVSKKSFVYAQSGRHVVVMPFLLDPLLDEIGHVPSVLHTKLFFEYNLQEYAVSILAMTSFASLLW